MSKLPVVSGDDLVRALAKIGYLVVRQKGSHLRLRHGTDPSRKPLSVPRHDEIKRGLLKDIMRDAGITTEELIELL